MSPLSHDQVVAICEAVVLAPVYPDKVSEFEGELIREIGHRFAQSGRNAVVTEAEWAALEPVAASLRTMETEERVLLAQVNDRADQLGLPRVR